VHSVAECICTFVVIGDTDSPSIIALISLFRVRGLFHFPKHSQLREFLGISCNQVGSSVGNLCFSAVLFHVFVSGNGWKQGGK